MSGLTPRFSGFLPILSPNSRSTKGGGCVARGEIILGHEKRAFGEGRSPLLGGNTLGAQIFEEEKLK